MLSTRLWIGTLLVLLTLGVVVADNWLSRWQPFLFVLVLGLALVSVQELLALFGDERPPPWLCFAAVTSLIVTNWLARWLATLNVWQCLSAVFAAIVVAAFLVEMARFVEPGASVNRIARTVWLASYVGLLPCFLIQTRWLQGDSPYFGTWALTLAVFVPKGCDIGAYFTGRLIGRHLMAPVLSPKKTWEGAAGGIIAAIALTWAIDFFAGIFPNPLARMAFGMSVGLAGMLGDLAESLIKRDCRSKDASHVVPGFGGVLDVVDAILFASPVAYIWFSCLT